MAIAGSGSGETNISKTREAMKVKRHTVGCAKRKKIQRNIFINKFRLLQRTQMLQQTWRNTIGRRSTRVRMTCRAFPLWLERQSSF